jgi:hypothetical protein
LRRRRLDSGVDLDPIRDGRADDRPGQLTGRGIGLDLGQVALQDGRRGPLPEVGLEHRRERDATPGPQAPDPVGALFLSRRRHRPGR